MAKVENPCSRITKIDDFIRGKLTIISSYTLEKELELSTSMLSKYRRGISVPSLDVAKRAYIRYGIVLHPYSRISLEYEVDKH